ncbi:MAG: hypothetical protein VW455_02280 [Nitrospinota bacterium]
MLDWKNCTPGDFSFQIDVEEIQEIGQRQNFPVRVFFKDGSLAFVKSITLRSDFYMQLRQQENWKEKLMEILKRRVREDIDERINSMSMTLDDKLEFMKLGHNAIN